MNRPRTWFTLALSVTVLSAAVAAQKVTITGAGATFPYPIYSKWFSDYNKLHPDVAINYQSIGSGGGVKQLTSQTVTFGASDYPLTPEQLQAAPGKILHFPTVLGAVVPIYNIPGVTAELKFSGPLLADIFLGSITKWNDSRIAKLNEGVTLPNMDITVVHRSDGSGTTYIFVDFLAKLSPEWKKRVGVAGSVNWPVGVGAKGNEAVAGMVKQTPGSLGYTEPAYATRLPSERFRTRRANSSRRRRPRSPQPRLPRSSRCLRISAFQSRIRRVTMSIPLPRLRGCSCIRIQKTRRWQKSWSTSRSGRSPTVRSTPPIWAMRRCRKRSSISS
jgi:ABC-type phosphate transport system substrate-binding protein